jgi:formamidopyrimidine-DNA glycosylase
MPELPEAEYMVLRLRECVPPGAMVKKVHIHRSSLVEGPVSLRARGPITGFSRRAKNVLVHFASGWNLRVQLGMTGHVYWVADRRSLSPWARVVFDLPGRAAIVFEDARTFGLLTVYHDREAAAIFSGYGPEPLEAGFTGTVLAAAMRSTKGPLKPALLDQSRVAGLGNIWAAEAVFAARLHPSRPVDSLDAAEWRRLARAIQQVLRRAIAGTMEVTKSAGEFPEADLLRTAVYGRAGDACRRCRATVQRMVQAGRATYFCAGCQT